MHLCERRKLVLHEIREKYRYRIVSSRKRDDSDTIIGTIFRDRYVIKIFTYRRYRFETRNKGREYRNY